MYDCKFTDKQQKKIQYVCTYNIHAYTNINKYLPRESVADWSEAIMDVAPESAVI